MAEGDVAKQRNLKTIIFYPQILWITLSACRAKPVLGGMPIGLIKK